jgi:hypothetical protein
VLAKNVAYLLTQLRATPRSQQRAREAREQRQASNNWESWWAMINQRIEQWLVAKRNPLTQASGEVLGRFRAELRKEFAAR